MKHEPFTTTLYDENINICMKSYSIPAMKSSYEVIRGEHHTEVREAIKIMPASYRSNFTVTNFTVTWNTHNKIKETEHFHSLPWQLKEKSRSVAELLQRGHRFEMMELDADEYGEAKIVVYLKRRITPREEIRLLRKMLKEVRRSFSEDKIHVVIDYLDRVPEI